MKGTLKEICAAHAARHRGVSLAELGEAMLRTVRQMSSDEKAHFRARLDRSLGFAPKSSNGKPS
jgi:hypothetical protein